MKMNNYFIALLLLICGNSFLAQERKNKVLPKVGLKVHGQLLKSTGWILNPDGQWVSRSNRIPTSLENEVKALIDHEYEGLGVDNFTSYQIRDIQIKDSSYLILIKNYKDGYYQYASIKDGWIGYNSIDYYVFKKDDLKKIDSIVTETTNLIKINSLYSGTITAINKSTYITDIQKSIAELDESMQTNPALYKRDLILHIAPYKKKNIIQFQIYSNSYNSIGGIINEHKINDPNGRYYGDKKQIYNSNELFKYCYYEVDYLTFSGFLKLTK